MGSEKTAVIDADHPAIAGHFPGHPVVPAAMILMEVMAAVSAGTRERVVAVPRVKFVSALEPGEAFAIRWEHAPDGLIAFTCAAAGRPVAMGRLALGPR
jgi:3-hydroxymyristoyl/3-hydroxydecanoyl-(acyl carrier protein) dehydratase